MTLLTGWPQKQTQEHKQRVVWNTTEKTSKMPWKRERWFYIEAPGGFSTESTCNAAKCYQPGRPSWLADTKDQVMQFFFFLGQQRNLWVLLYTASLELGQNYAIQLQNHREKVELEVLWNPVRSTEQTDRGLIESSALIQWFPAGLFAWVEVGKGPCTVTYKLTICITLQLYSPY